MSRTAHLAFAFSLAVIPCLSRAMPLEDAVRLAALRDPMIAALRQDVAQQETNIEIIKDGERPRISVNVGRATALGHDETLALQQNIGSEVVVSQMLFDWGKVSSQIEGASYDRVQIVSDLKKQIEAVIFNISGLYLDAESAKARLAATDEYRTNAIKLGEMTKDRAQGGLGDLSETSRAELERSRAEERLQTFESDREVALSQLNLLVGEPDVATQAVPNLDYAPRVDSTAAIDASIKDAPDYLKASAAVESARTGIDVAKASTKPTLRAEAAGHPGFSGGGPTSGSVGLVLGVDLGVSDLFGRQAQAAEQKYEGSQKRLEGVARDLKNQTQSYARQLRTLAASEALLKQQVDQARRVVSTYEEQFTAGLRSMTDLFTSIQELYSTQLNWIAAADQLRRTEYKAAQTLGLQGTLLQEKTNVPLPDLPTFLPDSPTAGQLQAQQPTAPFDDPGHYSMLPFKGREVMR
ncbi:TolC family protein [Chitinasiproducens palmae]|uniref:Outer membrane protein, adhesin transport system n=1 Tax=Chitinasiproducens palmae TaxID=1770053 RepID=A0A1H2PIT3_9BURK|nr:TolC family protein [Chitinasiproducens palmae]SDV46211.1 outer membrane protein, adhesin transport system [Chitinasiproducens palmae]